MSGIIFKIWAFFRGYKRLKSLGIDKIEPGVTTIVKEIKYEKHTFPLVKNRKNKIYVRWKRYERRE